MSTDTVTPLAVNSVQLRALLNISKATLHRWIKDKILVPISLPHTKRNRLFRFTDVQKLVK